jgi:hypothetical protein
MRNVWSKYSPLKEGGVKLLVSRVDKLSNSTTDGKHEVYVKFNTAAGEKLGCSGTHMVAGLSPILT